MALILLSGMAPMASPTQASATKASATQASANADALGKEHVPKESASPTDPIGCSSQIGRSSRVDIPASSRTCSNLLKFLQTDGGIVGRRVTICHDRNHQTISLFRPTRLAELPTCLG
jgi:hypothetical protein